MKTLIEEKDTIIEHSIRAKKDGKGEQEMNGDMYLSQGYVTEIYFHEPVYNELGTEQIGVNRIRLDISHLRKILAEADKIESRVFEDAEPYHDLPF